MALKAGLTPVGVGVCATSGGGEVEYVFVVVMEGGGSCLWLARLELLAFGSNAGLGCVDAVAVEVVAAEPCLYSW